MSRHITIFVAIGSAIALMYGGWMTTLNLLDSRYMTAAAFQEFESKQYIRDISDAIAVADKDKRVYEAKIISSVSLTEWEKILYEEAKTDKANHERELAAFLSSAPPGL